MPSKNARDSRSFQLTCSVVAAERHAPAGDVAAHAEQRQHRGGLARRPERLAQQRADARVARRRAGAGPSRRHSVRRSRQRSPGASAACHSHSLAAGAPASWRKNSRPLGDVAVVHLRRRRDRRPGRRVERAVRAADEEQQVAVAAEARAEPRAEARQARPVGEQEPRAAERSRGEHDDRARDLALGRVGRVEQRRRGGRPSPAGAGGSAASTRRRRAARCSVASQQQRIVAPAACAALRYVKSSVFLAPYWQPTMHSPHRRQA